MLQDSKPFSGYSVDNLDTARQFYGETLGLKLTDSGPGFNMNFPNGHVVFIYPKADHQPALFTVLNFPVENIDSTVDELAAKDIVFEQYNNPQMPQDDKGVLRGKSVQMGPNIAWFKDPAGNILSVLED